jgi:Helix-turn-helix domain
MVSLELKMRPSNGAVRTSQPIPPGPELEISFPLEPEQLNKGLNPRSVRFVPAANGHEALSLRLYTEEQVSDMLQVSLSQLRKWRMKSNRGKQLGPPFKKIGRLVRYPERSLQTYING